MRYLSLAEVLELHGRIIASSGGAAQLRDVGALESAVAQPQATFGGKELYPDLATKAAALAFSLIQNHPFLDGNKRIGHAAMETFLLLNGHELNAPVDAAERMILDIASSTADREALLAWIRRHLVATGLQ